MTKRQPKGIPAGGEFAANEHDEATSSLGGVEIVATDEQARAFSSAVGYGHAWMHRESQQAADAIVRKQHENPDADPDRVNDLLVRDYEDRDGTPISPEGHRQQRRAVHAVLDAEMKPYRPKRRQDAARDDEFIVYGNTPETGRLLTTVSRVSATQITDRQGNRWSIATGKEIGGSRTLAPAAPEDEAHL